MLRRIRELEGEDVSEENFERYKLEKALVHLLVSYLVFSADLLEEKTVSIEDTGKCQRKVPPYSVTSCVWADTSCTLSVVYDSWCCVLLNVVVVVYCSRSGYSIGYHCYSAVYRPLFLLQVSQLQYRSCLPNIGYVCVEVNGVTRDICCQFPSDVF